MNYSATRRDHLIAAFTAMAIGIHVLEASFPSPLPGIKPGLANVITLLVLLRYDFRAAVWVAALRVVIGSLVVGSFMSPTFMLSVSGAVASIACLGLVHALNQLFRQRLFSAIGYSLLSAWAHMLGQMFVAAWIFLPLEAVLKLAPLLLTAATVFGLMSGLCAAAVLAKLPPLQPVSESALK